MSAEFQEFLAVAEKTARIAGRILADGRPDELHIEYKGAINLVTEMDKKCEAYIVDKLSVAFPDHAIIAEEGSAIDAASEFCWYIDPLDGTTNYTHGLPIYCVSIALEKAGELVCGVIYDPCQEEMFTATKGGGTFLNGKQMRVSQETELLKSLLVTGFPYDIRETSEDNLNNFATFAKRARAVRRLGSAALDCCWTACGRFDGFWELKLSPWDLAAGVLMVREAGGTVTDLDGRPYQQMQDVLAEVNTNPHH
jgi:myo-inositol-1(or 4)-monophosphatase